MTTAVVGVILNALGVLLLIALDPSGYDTPLLWWVAGSWLISLFGLWVMKSGNRRGGAIVVILGSLFFVPMGLIAIYGAAKVLKAEKIAKQRQIVQAQWEAEKIAKQNQSAASPPPSAG